MISMYYLYDFINVIDVMHFSVHVFMYLVVHVARI